MKKITIYEPAMCCPTGLCGVTVDPELLRISTLSNILKRKGIQLERYNLTNSPMEFVSNKTVNKMVNEKGVDDLPFTLLDGEVVLTGRYPTNSELEEFLEMPAKVLDEALKIEK